MRELINHINSREKKIAALLSVPAKASTPETFHRLRVELKKTDAFFRLAEYSGKFNRKKRFAPLKSLFSAAGEVREIQVLESFLNDRYPEHPYLKELRSHLLRLKKEKRAAFFALRQSIPGKKIAGNFAAARRVLHAIERKTVFAFLDELHTESGSLLHDKKPDAAALHRFRKQLKIMTTLAKSLQKKHQRIPLLPGSAQLAIRLGNWHDLDVMAVRIAELGKQIGDPPQEREFLEHLSVRLAQKSRSLQDRLAGTCSKLFEKNIQPKKKSKQR